MISKWINHKDKAIRLRKKGQSVRDIEQSLSIPRSTLSGWFKNVNIAERHKKKLYQRWQQALKVARKRAVLVHNQQKERRIDLAKNEAKLSLDKINTTDKEILNLALAMLYMGEGFKGIPRLAIGNSDPLLLNFFLTVIKKNYGIADEKIRCDLHLRDDQNPKEMKKYWAKELSLPLACFKGAQIDKRTIGSPTYQHYKGVCMLTI